MYRTCKVKNQFSRTRVNKAPYIAILADETRDISNTEQLNIVIWWVSEAYKVNEDSTGMVKVPKRTADILRKTILDVLTRCSLPLENCCGQRYDGASINKSGYRSGVAKQIMDMNKAAVHVHCLAHYKNLCLQDVGKKIRSKRDALDLVMEIGQLIKLSPKRDHLFGEKQHENDPDEPGLKPLFPTRWTVRTSAVDSVEELHSFARYFGGGKHWIV